MQLCQQTHLAAQMKLFDTEEVRKHQIAFLNIYQNCPL